MKPISQVRVPTSIGADAVHVERLDVRDDEGAVADLVLHRLVVAEVHDHRLVTA